METQEFFECKTLFGLFQTKTDFKLRVEKPYISVYSNDINWLLNVTYKIANVTELWSPDPSIEHKLEKNIIIVEHPSDYPIKVTLGNGGVIDPGFINWANNNTNLIKIGPTLKEKILESGYVSGLYFYVRDEKILDLVSLMISSAIVRVEKLMCKDDIR